MKKSRTIVITMSSIIVIIAAMSLLNINLEAKKIKQSVELGNKYLLEGNYEEAIICFEELIEIDSKKADGYLGLVDVYTAQGNYEKVIETYNRAEIGVKEKEQRIITGAFENFMESIVVEDCVLNIIQGEKVDLPQSVKVIIGNVETTFSVEWETNTVDTAEAGTLEVKGFIKDINKEVKLIVNIEELPPQPEEVISSISPSILQDINGKLSSIGRIADHYTTLFDRNNYDEEELLRTVYMYIKFGDAYGPQNTDILDYTTYSNYYAISADKAVSIGDELFGVSISKKDYIASNENESILFKDNNFLFIAADGVIPNDITFADSIIDNKDGTFTTEQLEWINNKEEKEAMIKENIAGAHINFVEMNRCSIISSMIRDKCYELVNKYME